METLTILNLIVVLLSAWRISMLMSDVNEGGPFDILYKIRDILGVQYDEHSRVYGTNVLSRMWICYYCNSFWIGVVLTALLLLNVQITLAALFPFAISGAVILIQERQ